LKRIVKVLAATALMVVLMATTVSPAFAVAYGIEDEPDGPEGYGVDKKKNETGIGYGVNKKKNETGIGYGAQ
jgi:hypothetical protein